MNTNANLCGSKWGNTGVGNCGFDVDQINGFIVMPDTKTYNMASYATDALFLAALRTDATAALKSARIYPYFRVIDCVDNTAANSVTSTAYGIMQSSMRGKKSLTLTLDEVGMNQLMELGKFTGNKSISIALTDKKGGLHWQKTPAGLRKGFDIDLTDEAFKLPAGTTPSEKKVNIYFKEDDCFTAAKFATYMFDQGTVLKYELSGVHPVNINLISASTSAIVVEIQRADNFEDLGKANEAALEQVLAHLLVLASTGAAVTITTVTYNALNGRFTLAGTFTTALHYYSLKDPATLAGLSTPFGNGQTGGYESNVVAVTPA